MCLHDKATIKHLKSFWGIVTIFVFIVTIAQILIFTGFSMNDKLHAKKWKGKQIMYLSQINYQTPTFGLSLNTLKSAQKTAAKNGYMMGKIYGNLPKSKRAQRALREYPNYVNNAIAYFYFAKGKLQNVPEYVNHGIESLKYYTELYGAVHHSKDYLGMQEEMADKILTEPDLINNQAIKNNLYRIIHNGIGNIICPHDVSRPDIFYDELYSDRKNAVIKLLDAYVHDDKMKSNEQIQKYIADFAGDVKDENQANKIIAILKQNTDNKNAEFFENTWQKFRNEQN